MPTREKIVELIEAAKETREAMAAAARVIATSEKAMDVWMDDCNRHGVKEGFGVRLQNAIAACESSLTTDH